LFQHRGANGKVDGDPVEEGLPHYLPHEEVPGEVFLTVLPRHEVVGRLRKTGEVPEEAEFRAQHLGKEGGQPLPDYPSGVLGLLIYEEYLEFLSKVQIWSRLEGVEGLLDQHLPPDN